MPFFTVLFIVLPVMDITHNIYMHCTFCLFFANLDWSRK